MSDTSGEAKFETADDSNPRLANPPVWVTLVCIAVLAIAVVGLGVRAARLANEPGHVDPSRWVLQDFRDAVYYPVVAFSRGENPYDAGHYRGRYPVLDGFPPYSPLTLVVHFPFGLMPQRTAQILFFGSSVALTIALAALSLWLCGRRVTWGAVSILAAGIFASRPGHWNLLLGQTTQEIVPAVYVAAFFSASNVLLGGLGLAVATMKPSFGVPLALVLIAQRSLRTVMVGTALAVVMAAVPLVMIIDSAGGLPQFAHSVWDSYERLADNVSSNAVQSPVRIDAVSLIARILGRPPGIFSELLVLAAGVSIAGVASQRVRRFGNCREVALYQTSIASLAILISTYHLAYGAMLLVLPITSILSDTWIPPGIRAPRPARWVLLVLLLIPMVNYAASFRVLNRVDSGSVLWLAASSANAAALVAAFVLLAGLPFLPTRRPSDGGFRCTNANHRSSITD